MKELNRIYNEDCLVGMTEITDHSIDLIICDLPYGVLNKGNSNAKWDTPISLDELWEQYNRILKPNGVVVLFGQGMFSARLMMSNPKMWKYNLIWKKGNRPTGFLNAKKMPLRIHEDIIVFYDKCPTYNPQMVQGKRNHSRGSLTREFENKCYGNYDKVVDELDGQKYPTSVVDISKEHGKTFHPTQKPVELIEWLVRTYSNEGDLVLDNCMGSGSTAVACIRTKRNYIGFETDKEYYDKSLNRIETETIAK